MATPEPEDQNKATTQQPTKAVRKLLAPNKFKITQTFVKNSEREVDNLLAEVAATDGLLISNFTVLNVV